MAGEPNLQQGRRVGARNLVEGINEEEQCSICLEEIGDGTQMGISRLPCGHIFHLSCIGVAFNARGAMVCPNCRNVEHSPWRYSPARDHHHHQQQQDQEADDEDEYFDEDEDTDMMNDEDGDDHNGVPVADINSTHLRDLYLHSVGIHLDHQHHHHLFHSFNDAVIGNNSNYGDLSAHHHLGPASSLFQQIEEESRLLGIQSQRPLPVIGSIYDDHSNSVAGLFFPDETINHDHLFNLHPQAAAPQVQLPNSPVSFPTMARVGGACNIGQLLAELNQLNYPSSNYNNNNNNPGVLRAAFEPDRMNSSSSFSQMLQDVIRNQEVQLPPPPPPPSPLQLHLASSSTPPTVLPQWNHRGSVCPGCCSVGDCLELDLNLSIDGGSLY